MFFKYKNNFIGNNLSLLNNRLRVLIDGEEKEENYKWKEL